MYSEKTGEYRMNNSSKLDLLYGVRWLSATFMAVWFGLPHILQALVILSAVDMFFGVCAAIVQDVGFKPKIFFIGITKKLMVMVFAVIASIGTHHLIMEGYDVGFDAGKVVAFYYIVWEITSLIENMGLAGLPIPNQIKSLMSQLRKIQGVPDPAPMETSAVAEVKLTVSQTIPIPAPPAKQDI